MVLINAPADMRWLRDVHLPGLPKKFKAAVIHGNEDAPERIDVYSRKNPFLSDIPLVFLPNEEGVYERALHLEM